jgi:hypothetical protein
MNGDGFFGPEQCEQFECARSAITRRSAFPPESSNFSKEACRSSDTAAVMPSLEWHQEMKGEATAGRQAHPPVQPLPYDNNGR